MKVVFEIHQDDTFSFESTKQVPSYTIRNIIAEDKGVPTIVIEALIEHPFVRVHRADTGENYIANRWESKGDITEITGWYPMKKGVA